mmetsp:Transcript_90173/g.291809  ORF Transcript_90173/g.291809 Transcript_90173/m.291809 type:complete len:371 (-) Transcript_90173:138-1250(-)
MEEGSRPLKRPRPPVLPVPSRPQESPHFDLLQFLGALPKDLGTPCGDTLNVALLRLLGHQAVALCCRDALDWWSLGGRRIVLCLNEECRGPKGPFAPLGRLAGCHVETVRLGRYGRRNAEESADLIGACTRMTLLRCVYSKLTGIGPRLEQVSPRLLLRRVKFHQCRLEVADVVQVFRLASRLEVADFYGESLAGLGEALAAAGVACPDLRSLEFNDCGLAAEDVAGLLRAFGGLRSVHVQASDLHGLRPPRLPALEVLRLLDCQLSREDAVAVMAQCPRLESLSLCGNPLGSDDLVSDVSWPSMPSLRAADFRNCELDSDDEEALRECLPGCAGLQLRAAPAQPVTAASAPEVPAAGRHIVFESSSDEE